MASRRTWMHGWLVGPSLGQYFEIRSNKKEESPEPTLNSTKQLLKKHMVDSFFERALHQIDPSEKEALQQQAESSIAIEEAPVGYYIFAITLERFEIRLPEKGIEPDYALFVFGFGKAQAVISKVPLSVYGENALQARLNDPSWFEQTLRRHNNILSQIQSQTFMVPMRVCTICDSMEGLSDFLEEHHDDFVSTLELIEGNQAWRFSIFCNQRKLRHLTERASNRVRAIQAELSGKLTDDGDPLWQKLESVLEEEARSVCRACIKHSHGMLSSLASRNLIHSQASLVGADTNEQEIFRCEYLVANKKEPHFTKEIQTLIQSYKSLGFDLKIEGPMAPGEFAKRNSLPGTSAVAIAPPKPMDLGETA